MTTITNRAEFEQMLTAEQAVLFTFFAWSGQAVASLRVFEEWSLEWLAVRPEACVAFYRLDPDVHPDTWSWLTEQAHREHDNDRGFGAVTWLRRGTPVAFVRYAAEVGKQGLSRLADEHFRTTHTA
jgi:hypothetical protein